MALRQSNPTRATAACEASARDLVRLRGREYRQRGRSVPSPRCHDHAGHAEWAELAGPADGSGQRCFADGLSLPEDYHVGCRPFNQSNDLCPRNDVGALLERPPQPVAQTARTAQ